MVITLKCEKIGIEHKSWAEEVIKKHYYDGKANSCFLWKQIKAKKLNEVKNRKQLHAIKRTKHIRKV